MNVATGSKDFNKKNNNIYFINAFFSLLFLLHVTHEGASSFLPLLSCPADWCLHRMAACAASPGAEADVDGFTHLKALVGQPQDERWPLGGKKRRGWGLILPSLLLLLSPPFPLSLVLLPLLTSQLGLHCANRASHGAGRLPWIEMLRACQSLFLNGFDRKVPKENVCRQSSSFDWQGDLTDVHVSNPFAVIEKSRLKCKHTLCPLCL